MLSSKPACFINTLELFTNRASWKLSLPPFRAARKPWREKDTVGEMK